MEFDQQASSLRNGFVIFTPKTSLRAEEWNGGGILTGKELIGTID